MTLEKKLYKALFYVDNTFTESNDFIKMIILADSEVEVMQQINNWEYENDCCYVDYDNLAIEEISQFTSGVVTVQCIGKGE